MSLIVFDDEKINDIKKRNEAAEESTINFDVVEASREAKGGSELVYARVKERVPEAIWDYYQVILSRVRTLEDKPKILWFQAFLWFLCVFHRCCLVVIDFV